MIDLGWFGYLSFDTAFLSSLLSIVFINLVVSGDNAVIIALAVRSLKKSQRSFGIFFGSAAAVLLRVILTFSAAKLLQVPFLKVLGGALIAWIAVNLFAGGVSEDKVHEATDLFHAIKIICIADLVMSIDNVLAVAGASKGNMFLLLFGLGSSIPFVVGTSTLLSTLMDKYPIIIYIGAAVLGKVAGEMIITDPAITKTLRPGHALEYAMQAILAFGVIIAGELLTSFQRRKTKR